MGGIGIIEQAGEVLRSPVIAAAGGRSPDVLHADDLKTVSAQLNDALSTLRTHVEHLSPAAALLNARVKALPAGTADAVTAPLLLDQSNPQRVIAILGPHLPSTGHITQVSTVGELIRTKRIHPDVAPYLGHPMATATYDTSTPTSVVLTADMPIGDPKGYETREAAVQAATDHVTQATGTSATVIHGASGKHHAIASTQSTFPHTETIPGKWGKGPQVVQRIAQLNPAHPAVTDVIRSDGTTPVLGGILPTGGPPPLTHDELYAADLLIKSVSLDKGPKLRARAQQTQADLTEAETLLNSGTNAVNDVIQAIRSIHRYRTVATDAAVETPADWIRLPIATVNGHDGNIEATTELGITAHIDAPLSETINWAATAPHLDGTLAVFASPSGKTGYVANISGVTASSLSYFLDEPTRRPDIILHPDLRAVIDRTASGPHVILRNASVDWADMPPQNEPEGNRMFRRLTGYSPYSHLRGYFGASLFVPFSADEQVHMLPTGTSVTDAVQTATTLATEAKTCYLVVKLPGTTRLGLVRFFFSSGKIAVDSGSWSDADYLNNMTPMVRGYASPKASSVLRP